MTRNATWSARMMTRLIAATVAILVAAPDTSAAEDVIRSVFGLLGAAMRVDRYAAPAAPDGRLAYAAAPLQLPMDISPPPSAPLGAAGNTSFCVRLCDGRYFPLSGPAASSPASAASMCTAMCPASKTAVYRGGRIEDATANSGGRYGDLRSAFVYRQAIVPGCTCNGGNPAGLARIDPAKDPTLRAGDVVASPEGLKVFKDSAGRARGISDFTPIGSTTSLSVEFRRKLATVRVSSGGRY